MHTWTSHFRSKPMWTHTPPPFHTLMDTRSYTHGHAFSHRDSGAHIPSHAHLWVRTFPLVSGDLPPSGFLSGLTSTVTTPLQKGTRALRLRQMAPLPPPQRSESTMSLSRLARPQPGPPSPSPHLSSGKGHQSLRLPNTPRPRRSSQSRSSACLMTRLSLRSA